MTIAIDSVQIMFPCRIFDTDWKHTSIPNNCEAIEFVHVSWRTSDVIFMTGYFNIPHAAWLENHESLDIKCVFDLLSDSLTERLDTIVYRNAFDWFEFLYVHVKMMSAGTTQQIQNTLNISIWRVIKSMWQSWPKPWK